MITTDSVRIQPVLHCTDLDAMVAFCVEQLGMRIESISPADSPSVIVLNGGGLAIRLQLGDTDVAADFVVRATNGNTGLLVAPNGARFELVVDIAGYHLPDAVPSFSLTRSADVFGVGRAAMEYRDLLPDRWGGRFIASHIRIPDGGPVPDSVHYHRVRFQMIFCASGWVDVVYEDQGQPFRLEAGDCVLQPPEIRHRVLHASPGVEVIEIGCPAVHDTFIDHDLELPTASLRPERDFGGQRFVHDVAADALWKPSSLDGLRVRETGVGDSTNGLAGASVISADGVNPSHGIAPELRHDGEFLFDVVLSGSADLVVDDGIEVRHERVGRHDAIALPPTHRWSWTNWTDDFEFLEVALPGRAPSV